MHSTMQSAQFADCPNRVHQYVISGLIPTIHYKIVLCLSQIKVSLQLLFIAI